MKKCRHWKHRKAVLGFLFDIIGLCEASISNESCCFLSLESESSDCSKLSIQKTLLEYISISEGNRRAKYFQECFNEFVEDNPESFHHFQFICQCLFHDYTRKIRLEFLNGDEFYVKYVDTFSFSFSRLHRFDKVFPFTNASRCKNFRIQVEEQFSRHSVNSHFITFRILTVNEEKRGATKVAYKQKNSYSSERVSLLPVFKFSFSY